MGKSVVSIRKMIVGILAVLMVMVAVANATSESVAMKDGTYKITATALQEVRDSASQMDRNLIKPVTLRVEDGKVFAILKFTGSANLGSFNVKNAAGEFEPAEVLADDKGAGIRTIRVPVDSIDKQLFLRVPIIRAPIAPPVFRVAFVKESLEQVIAVTLNSEDMDFEVSPMIVQGRTLVPLSAIFDALGAEFVWDHPSQTVTGTKGGTIIKLAIGNTTAHINDKPVTLDVPGKIVNQRTLVPLRFISESLGAYVEWEGATRTVIIKR